VHDHAPDQTAAQAAAWENWGQIRDTFLGQPAQVSEPVSAVPAPDQEQEPKPEAMAAAAGAGNASSESESDSAIASIVDSVLAELKPKLMEEISRKMRKDSKKD
jgi:hypothetical protein